jgi:tellurite resistance protein
MIGGMKNPPWLARFPVGLFAIPVGLFALAGAWRRAQTFDWPFAQPVAQALAWTGVLLLALLLLTYLAKCLRHPQAVHAEFTHPLAGSLMALLPLSLLLYSIYFGKPGHPGWLVLVLTTLVLQGVIAIRIVAIITSAELQTAAVSPALYIPPVAGGFVGGMALNVLGYPGWAAMLFGMGLASWALLEVRVLNRLFEGAMPEPLRPTIGLEMAPPTVGTLAAGLIWPQLPGEVLIVGLGVAAGPIVAVLARYKWWHQVPFSIGFWSFSFPLAALAGATVDVVRRGGWPPAVGAAALAVASSVIGFLLLRTLVLLLRGRLIPAPPPVLPKKPKLPA